jgi:aryl-alcohol dehydrogenase-like predicted oxidoreductase
MVHWPVNAVSLQHYTDNSSLIGEPPDIREAFAELAALKQSGKIRHVGVSNFGVGQLAEIADFPVAVNQMCYNLLTRSIEFEILPHCMERRIQILGYMPLMQGLLTGKYAAIKDIPWQRTRTRHFSGRRQGARHGGPGFEPILEKTLSELNALSAELDIPLMQLSLAWAIAKKGVACTINGVRSVEQLHQNVQAVQLTLDPDIINRLDGITEALKHALGSNPDLYEPDARSRTY